MFGGFPRAAATVFQTAHPERPVPKTAEEIIAALREREPALDEAAGRLAARRAEVAPGAR